jgi:hypothetical protein
LESFILFQRFHNCNGSLFTNAILLDSVERSRKRSNKEEQVGRVGGGLQLLDEASYLSSVNDLLMANDPASATEPCGPR